VKLVVFYKQHILKICVIFLLIGTNNIVFARSLTVSPKIETTINVYETKTDSDEPLSNEAIIILPSLLSSYSTKRVNASLSIDHTVVEQNDDIDGANKNYTELKYNSTFILLKNALNITFSGLQNYRVIDSQLSSIGDKLLLPGELTKYRNNTAGLSFSLPNPKYVGFDLQSSISETKTDESLDRDTGLDNENLSFSANLYSGDYTKNYNFNFSAQYNKSDRTEFQNYSSTNINGQVGISISKAFDWIITGSSEKNDTGILTLLNINNFDTTQYGSGIKWNSTTDRAISLTYEQSEQENEETNFIGVDVDWAFSDRTVLKFNYGKRFFGDAYDIDFSHSTKSIRTSLTYSEQVTTFGLLGNFSFGSSGLFVCEFGSTDLFSCFQPDSIDYELKAGEEFRAVTSMDSDINENAVLRKTGRFSIGYAKRKLTALLNVSHTSSEYLESDRLQNTRTLELNLSYALGRKTNIALTTKVDKRQFDELSDVDTNITLGLNFIRRINNNLKFTTSARFLDRESDTASRNLTDRRLTLGIDYIF
jgi:uncharacterized protein (PEP-CTERM system associated)